jgi:hypothetical protein
MQKAKYTIVANHPAYGDVSFELLATDEKHAFSQWKQIVCNPRQWIVRQNEKGTANASPSKPKFVPPTFDHDDLEY